ncbi:hypothetical protein DVR12_06615 [Chitinophaga silvatica]|uniref:Uncharacterized protein n=1 Tax=Chitinophaga silvatica TaxID=2282649 RepID=A0A3E1YEC7_9BACT|nr:hypothetical protein [Chitinophaga silvatica]RFS24858.1 hypothetical protein DVR12_06615 [Chitinophaga silvatica]
MTSKEYIENKLIEAVNLFPKIRCRCEYDIFAEAYYIEICPSSFYKNKEFDKWLDTTIMSFFKQKYPVGICIHPRGRSKIVENCEFEIQGSLYKSRKKVTTQLANL